MRNYRSTPVYAVLTALLVFAIGPLVVLVFNALKTRREAATDAIGPPSSVRLQNFVDAFDQGNLGQTMLNSALITAGTVIGVCVIAGLAAYALTRLEIRGGGAVTAYLLVATAIPAQLFLVPLFFLWTNLGLYDSRFGLVVIYWALYSPLATLLLRSYFVGLPRDFEDAARIDGAGELRVLRDVVLPLARPGLTTVALVVGLFAWNEFFFAITFLQDDTKMPVVTSYLAFTQSFTRDWTLTSAAALIIVLPVLVLFIGLQRKFIDGLTASGLKG
ncbi:carbohydrate ABC transporter permease [Conexibacter stalactiti]|uniref:Carbohydrate ABC transporter permease n=1 Tax=Conexibacter stalactiti TaxID=1940611 RepID=A0ABU4HVN0_9ACTN|nr:carbohydrate ABC transporter permease [Conexibacter stalactiti]MDW5597391.1 carbohydrate ABC transporter permease [Conexibacter stalactiti]MEC5038033.1 carbohydrate ABC transporter permease [Conexibacter stalactiti]